MATGQEVREALDRLFANIAAADAAVELLHERLDNTVEGEITEEFKAELLSKIVSAEEALAKVPTRDNFPAPPT